jgi:transcriptional regulator with XRE-family HTH domain
MGHEYPKDENAGLGSPKFFGKVLRGQRISEGATLQFWAKKSGLDTSALSRYERGEQSLPSLNLILVLAGSIPFDDVTTDKLLIAAGYLPRIPFILDQERLLLLNGAFGELFRKRDTTLGYIGIIQRLSATSLE